MGSQQEIQTDAKVVARARVGSRWLDGDATRAIIDPYRGTVVGEMPVSTADDCDAALGAARAACPKIAAMPAYERAAILRRVAATVEERAASIGRVMAQETGKAISDCITEVARSADTLRLCAEEAVRIQGEHVPMDATAIGASKIAMALRFPVGVVAAITPFNAPVNLAAHKVGPAIAAGNAIVLKPSPKAPLSFHLFMEAFFDCGLPDGAVNTVYGDSVGPQLVTDPRVDFVSFTGSIPVGRAIRSAIGIRRVALELGGVGPTFVHHDADIAAAAKACARNGILLAGQSCISVQNVHVARQVHDQFLDLVRREIEAIRFGDPLDPATEVGTLIDEGAARRVEGMIGRAVEQGAVALCGGSRQGAAVPATLLTGATADMEVVRDELFGPAISVLPYDEIEPVFDAISRSPYGLQCGIFTNSLDLALKAYRSVRTGGVIVNATSRWRSDQMPYGGVKDSGIGREGPKYAIRDMTEERLLVLN